MLTVVPPPAVTISQGQMSTQPVVGDFQVEYSALTVREHELDRKFQVTAAKVQSTTRPRLLRQRWERKRDRERSDDRVSVESKTQDCRRKIRNRTAAAARSTRTAAKVKNAGAPHSHLNLLKRLPSAANRLFMFSDDPADA